jgi:hypothetical protein
MATKKTVEKVADSATQGQAEIKPRKAAKKRKARKQHKPKSPSIIPQNDSKYPRHSIERSLRVAKALLDQNGGHSTSDREAAKYVKVGYAGPFTVELGSGIKYGFLVRPSHGHVAPTDLAKKILRPQSSTDAVDGMRQGVLNAPVISDVYKHYRGENLPDLEFLENALVDKFTVPRAKVSEFLTILLSSLESAKLLEKTPSGKERVIDVSHELGEAYENDRRIAQGAKEVKTKAGDVCFVMMPFASPVGDHFEKLYDPAIRKAGLTPLRADNEIFGTGKIMDQIWSGITNAKILLCELTGRNPNVFYELGLAHASKKPVVLISNREDDVPFDLKHIRVIYYDKDDPFGVRKSLRKSLRIFFQHSRIPKRRRFLETQSLYSDWRGTGFPIYVSHLVRGGWSDNDSGCPKSRF